MKRWTTLAGAGLALTLATPALATEIGGGLIGGFGEGGSRTGFEGNVFFSLPGADRLALGGSVSAFLGSGVVQVAIDPALHLRLLSVPLLDVYALGGVDVLVARAHVLDTVASDLSVGPLFGAGATVKLGPLHPYGEARLALHDKTWLGLVLGLRIGF